MQMQNYRGIPLQTCVNICILFMERNVRVVEFYGYYYTVFRNNVKDARLFLDKINLFMLVSIKDTGDYNFNRKKISVLRANK